MTTAMTAGALAEWFGRVDLAGLQVRALEDAAGRLAAAVREALSVPGGAAAPGEAPSLRSGALRDSVSFAVADGTAVVGSTDPVASYQEQGTRRVAPRPFLAPAAASLGEGLAREIGAVVAEGLR